MWFLFFSCSVVVGVGVVGVVVSSSSSSSSSSSDWRISLFVYLRNRLLMIVISILFVCSNGKYFEALHYLSNPLISVSFSRICTAPFHSDNFYCYL